MGPLGVLTPWKYVEVRWTRWRRPVRFTAVPNKTEFIWSRRDETSDDATEVAMASSKDERICLKQRMW